MTFFKIIRKVLPGLLIVGLLVGFGCSGPSGSDEDDEGGEGGGEETTTYELTVEASPSDGGSVDPESGTYEEGEEITVEAIAEDGWSFSGWSGDISSDENPLAFEIDSDTEISANFEEQPREYSKQVEVTDGTYAEDITFGMDDNGTAGYDEGLDEEAPPEPPEGSFYANFVIDNYNLYADYRAVTDDRVEWELHFGTGSENNITLNWDFNPDDYHGSLMLVDDPDDASIEVDMGSDSSYEVTDNSINTLYIIQE